MAIPSPTIPSASNAVTAVRLNPTENNRAFYIYSGLIAADNTETTVISVNDIGKRDILFCMNPMLTVESGDNMSMKVKSNGSVVYQTLYDQGGDNGISWPMTVHLILPANSSLEVTFTNSDASSHEVGIAAYGYYMEKFQ